MRAQDIFHHVLDQLLSGTNNALENCPDIQTYFNSIDIYCALPMKKAHIHSNGCKRKSEWHKSLASPGSSPGWTNTRPLKQSRTGEAPRQGQANGRGNSFNRMTGRSWGRKRWKQGPESLDWPARDRGELERCLLVPLSCCPGTMDFWPVHLGYLENPNFQGLSACKVNARLTHIYIYAFKALSGL